MKQLRIFLIKYIIYPTLKTYWKTFKPSSIGVRVIITDDKGRILFIKHSYKKKWYLPGGGLKRLEKSIDGVMRETKEEVNLDLKNVNFHGIYRGIEDGKNDWMLIFTSNPVDTSVLKVDEVEIIDHRWLSKDEFTSYKIDKRSKRAVDDLVSKCPIYHLDI